ncbi:helix-turn-helix domain-containing protein [Nocardia sp. NPDC052112]|uniref:helix-turn-helix domain-containing protein n=1 Tax=Nocardia sp. NPDC052112 TaxID=3155646 RepID=UPI00343D31CD
MRFESRYVDREALACESCLFAFWATLRQWPRSWASCRSERTFARTFRAETGTTPAYFIENLRLEAARRLLESTDLTVDAIARTVGYKHGKTLHRVIARRLSTTPDVYRQQFASTTAAHTQLNLASAELSSHRDPHVSRPCGAARSGRFRCARAGSAEFKRITLGL